MFNNPGPDANYTIATPGQPFQFSETLLGPGISSKYGQQNNNNKLYNQLLICVYTVGSLFLSLPAKAEAPVTTNVAGPSASATGNVTNQAVQVLQGPYPVNTYGGGVSCSGPSMAITPFVLGSNNWDDDPENFAGYTAMQVCPSVSTSPWTGILIGFVVSVSPLK